MRSQAQLAIDSADVIIMVTDMRSGVVATDVEVASMLQKSGRPIVLCVNKLRKKGARNVIVSLGGEGALLFAEDGHVYHSGVVRDKVLNTVGSGDSMVAGFIAGYERTRDYAYSLKLGAACGNATALSSGLAGRMCSRRQSRMFLTTIP